MSGVHRPLPDEPTRAELLDQIAVLQARLATMPAIEQAKGALMATYGLTADAAFALLRWHSQHTNVKVRSIAAELTAGPLQGSMSKGAAARLDRLLGDITNSLVTTGAPANLTRTSPGEPVAAAANTPVGDLLSFGAGELPEMVLRAVNAATHGITIAVNSGDRPLLYANDAFLQLTGYQHDQVLGRNCRFLRGPGTDPVDTAAIAEALDAGKDISRVIRNYRLDGTAFWNEVTISAVQDPTKDRISHFIGTQIGVTEQAHRYQ